MSDTIQTKRCTKCKQIKPISEFYKDAAHKDGFRNYCKTCNRRYNQTEKGKARKRCYEQTEKYRAAKKRYTQTEKGKASQKRYVQSEKFKANQKRYRQNKKGKASYRKAYLRNPEKFKARKAVTNAIRAGRLPRPDSLQCHYCPAQAEEYHHHKGYAQKHRLDVIPVCIKCHSKSEDRCQKSDYLSSVICPLSF